VHLLETNADLARWRDRSKGHVLVPTMGALHEGHRSLVRQAADLAERRSLPGGCIVSIFVNPTQFNQRSDFDHYPRELGADLDKCAADGAAAVYAPGVDDVYPQGAALPSPALPPVAREPGLEDTARPGHFEGVCRVVVRLFDLVAPDAAVFGEKDWQQLQVVRALVAEASLGVDIVPGRIVRDADGLALSSRNVRLTPEARSRALAIPAALRAGGDAPEPVEAEAIMRAILSEAGVEVAYAVVRDAETLLAPRDDRPRRALIAGTVGGVHLLDNAPWPAS